MNKPITALLLLLLPCCTLARMQVRPELAAGEQQPFERSMFDDSSLRFGRYRLADLDRSATDSNHDRSTGLLPDWIRSTGESRAVQDFSFVLTLDGKPARAVRCRASMTGSDVRFKHGSMSSATQRLHCGLFDAAGGTELARLQLEDNSGTLQAGGRPLKVEARDLQGGAANLTVSGWALQENGQDLAAVMTVNNGAAWIAPSLDEGTRTLAAALCATLLTYRPLRDQ
jgi:hypothetical protein